MKLKLDFVNKVPKEAKDNEIILVKDKAAKNKIVKLVNKSLFSNKLFLQKLSHLLLLLLIFYVQILLLASFF